jgi:uncharacterized SAM-binding protein YcdF (DUF218 family)
MTQTPPPPSPLPVPSPEDIAAAEVLWDYHCIYDPPRPADAIIGLGSYDLRVADWCAELFEAGFAPFVLFTGASGNWTRDLYGMSEAKAFAKRAEEKGVPRSAIMREERATNIGENIRFSAAICRSLQTVILATKPQTQRRVRATAQRQWIGIDAIVTAPLHPFEEQPSDHHGMAELICEMVGDVWRMKSYPAKGFQSEQAVPEAVEAAYRHLVAQGYSAHLPDGAKI